MSAVLTAPLSAKKPIEAIYSEINKLGDILREVREELVFLKAFPATLAAHGRDGAARVVELELREENALLLMRGLRDSLAYELDREAS